MEDLGPRKRKLTSRVTDNADPLLKHKKPRLAPKTVKPTPKRVPRRHPSVEIEEVDDEANITYGASPKSTNHIIEVADGSDESESGGVDADEEDKVEEDGEPAEAELRESKTNIYSI